MHFTQDAQLRAHAWILKSRELGASITDYEHFDPQTAGHCQHLGVAGALVCCLRGKRSDAIAADQRAIKDAIAQYAYRWDGKDSAGFAELFTDDAVMERWLLGEMQSTFAGRDTIAQYAATAHAGRLADRQTRHHMSSIVFIELTDDSALTENMVLITHQTTGALPEVSGTGIYRMTWQKTDAGWKIAKRILFSDLVAGEAE